MEEELQEGSRDGDAVEVNKQEEFYALAHDARLVNLSEGLLFPILKRREENYIAQLCSKFDAGESSLLTEVARLSEVRSLIRELKRVQAKGNKASEELNELSRKS